MGNLRQFGAAILMRAGETGDIPPYKDFSQGVIWRSQIQPYLPVSIRQDSCRAESVPFSGSYTGNFYAHYGWPAITGAANSQPNGSKKVTAIANHSKFMVLTDTKGSWYLTVQNRVQMDSTVNFNFAFRHEGRANLLFLDGHAEARLPADIPSSDDKTTAEYRAFWLGLP